MKALRRVDPQPRLLRQHLWTHPAGCGLRVWLKSRWRRNLTSRGTGRDRGSFTRWLQVKLPEFEKVPDPSPGWVIDPDRVDRNELPAASGPSLNRLQEQTATIADVPRLSQEHYDALHRALAEDAQRHEFRRFDMSKRVRNALQLDDVPVSRA